MRWPVGALTLIGLAALTPYLSPRQTAQWVTVSEHFRPCGDGGSGPCAVDGDTIVLDRRRVRLTGFDAPEIHGACPRESKRAQAAKRALVVWLAKGSFEWDGGADPPRDRYGRELRAARRGDQLLADHMIEAGLAEGSGWGARAIDWCATD